MALSDLSTKDMIRLYNALASAQRRASTLGRQEIRDSFIEMLRVSVKHGDPKILFTKPVEMVRTTIEEEIRDKFGQEYLDELWGKLCR